MTDTTKQNPSEFADFGFQKVKWDDKQDLVNNVFAKVADKYDLMNDLMSGGMHRLWKNDMIAWIAPPKSGTPCALLDVAGGTGDIAFRFLKTAGHNASATICDISPEMLQVGRKRAETKAPFADLDFVTGNAEDLPFPDKSFDIYTIAFGIRNVPNITKALKEARRVLKTGGRFMCLEFSEVQVPILDDFYDAYSFHAIPRLGSLAASDSDSYQYLVESIRKFPKQKEFAALIEDAGFEQVKYRNLSGGIAAIHSGWRL